MKLTLGKIYIKDIGFGEKTCIKSGVLYIDRKELANIIKQDERIKDVQIELARPGEEVRIIPVKDVIQPIYKVEGPGGVFPGMISKVDMAGTGRTRVLEGCAVVTAGNIVGFQEGIIDMTGPGAEYTPFSKTLNVVLVCTPVDGIEKHDHEAVIRMAGLKAASYLGKAGAELTPDKEETYEWPSVSEALNRYPGLPKVGYVYMLQTQGLLHDTYVYGVDAKRIIPTLISPTEVMDGAIVSGNCVSACDKNTTYHHQNNPVIHDLFERHGRDYNFIGIIITNENVTLPDKIRSSGYASKLCEMLGLDAVIITEEGFGNPDSDLIMNCVKLEEKGIKTVLITDEYAGQDGASQSLADANPKADAVITAGNANEVITLPPMKKIIGILDPVERIAGGFSENRKPDGSIQVEIQAITGSTNEMGFSMLSAQEY